MTRNVGIIHRQLQAQDRAVSLGETFPDGPAPPPLDDVTRAVPRVRALFPETAAATPTWLHYQPRPDVPSRLSRQRPAQGFPRSHGPAKPAVNDVWLTLG